MAENTPEDNAAEGAAPKSKNLLLIIVGAVLLVLAGGGGAYFFLLSSAPAEESTEPAAVVIPTGPIEYLDLSPAFIVSYPYQGRQRYLQASLSVMSRDPGAMDAVVEHMPIIRHNLLNLFTAQMLGVAESPSSGIEELRQLATEEVKHILHEEIGRDGIEEVLFTAFVTQ
ncbi:MAG: flagellar basal body-associated FliL family protein [Gammaproteobacteria bacterium]